LTASADHKHASPPQRRPSPGSPNKDRSEGIIGRGHVSFYISHASRPCPNNANILVLLTSNITSILVMFTTRKVVQLMDICRSSTKTVARELLGWVIFDHGFHIFIVKDTSVLRLCNLNSLMTSAGLLRVKHILVWSVLTPLQKIRYWMNLKVGFRDF